MVECLVAPPPCRPVLAVIGPQWSCWTFEKCLLLGLPGSNCPSGVFTCVSLTSALSYSPPRVASLGDVAHAVCQPGDISPLACGRRRRRGALRARGQRQPIVSAKNTCWKRSNLHLCCSGEFLEGFGGGLLSLSGSSDVTGGRRRI